MRLGKTRFRRVLLAGSAAIVVALVLVWSQRRPIAAGAIDRMLAARGVVASYTVTDIGFRRQLIENLRVGDPARPDLTAARVEVSLVPSWGGVAVVALDARGVRLRGRVVKGRVSWGAVDKLLPEPTGKPLVLPAVDMRLADTRIMLDSGIGSITADVAGSGKLSDGFEGRIVARADFVGDAGCRLARPTVSSRVTIGKGRPRLAGTLTSQASSCGEVGTGAVAANYDLGLDAALVRWTGTASLATTGLRQGSMQVAAPTARLSFDGSRLDTGGSFSLTAPAARYAGHRLAALAAEGRFSTGRGGALDGRVRIGRLIADPAMVGAVRRGLAAAAGTPAGPLATALSAGITRAAAGAAVEGAISYRDAVTRLADVRIAARGGGVLTIDGDGVSIGKAGVGVDAAVALSGGGFPDMTGRLVRGGDGSTRGIFNMAAYRAGGARLALSPIRIAARRDGGLRLETLALLDGPLGDGRVEGLQMPVIVQRTASGELLVAPGCTALSYRRVALAGAILSPGGITLCPVAGGSLLQATARGVRGGACTGAVRIAGRVGEQAMTLAASATSFELGGPLSLADVSAVLGGADRRTQVEVARIDGRIGARGLSGRYAGLAGQIARVPIRARAGRGGWTLAGGVFDLGGTMTITDAAAAARFNPLRANAVKLRIADGQVAASATLVEPVSDRAVTAVALAHDLSQGAGRAQLRVDGLTFGKSLQPEAITPMTLGVVADVFGQITGTGDIRWHGSTVSSTGAFRTDGLDFAAAFGPVTGASGEIVFDDLIALSTPPGQQVKLALVNPGVEVTDGVITYRLRPNQVVEIERGRWPFAGGELLLEAGRLDMGRPDPRSLSFRVIGLDAAKFIEQLKLENVAATGIFDGTLPIVFDASGGRIFGGQIVARAGGGTLAYVGDVSNAETNTLAKLAFDALKSIRYDNLAIDLDGSLDGEIVSLVRFDGVNQSPVAPSGLARSFTGLPFKFNIRVRAPFRGLVNTARSYQDPGLLLNRTVQPVASDRRP